ncbi:signal peptidase I [Paenibacillus sp. IITD108]|uniref:signal peptidase I n=1 Tax=Paenibacillus sp. IITD108 TaxID=3116649 RepID=UPI002F3F5F5C
MQRSKRSEFISWMKTISLALVIVIILHTFVFQLSIVKGHSMEPTLKEKEVLFINKWKYLFGSPKVGDVVILENPLGNDGKEKLLVKRIVGAPGDKIEVYDRLLYRNGQQVNESYIDTEIEGESFGPYEVQADQYFVMGDNRRAQASLDSRDFAAVDRKLILGKADFIIWPLSELNSL